MRRSCRCSHSCWRSFGRPGRAQRRRTTKRRPTSSSSRRTQPWGPNGDTIAISGEGKFGVHPKSASGGGEFTHTLAGGGSFTSSWVVNRLVDFQPYGCGVIFGTPIEDFLCGGRVSLDVTFTGPAGPIPGRITIYCLIGSPPPSAEEGVRVVIPGIANFNKQVSGDNVYIKQ